MTTRNRSRVFTLQPTDYLIGPTIGNPDLCLSWPQATVPSGDGIDWQFGEHDFRVQFYALLMILQVRRSYRRSTASSGISLQILVCLLRQR